MLKRKRSASEICSSPSSSTFSSPPHQHTFSVAVSPPRNPFSPRMFDAHPPHLHSRTVKRFRDNRPSEEEVHQHTLSLLFKAQRQHIHQPSFASPQSLVEGTDNDSMQMRDTLPGRDATAAQGSANQGGLHRFWNINSAPLPMSSAPEVQAQARTQCEDCGSGLGGDGDGMDLDGFAFGSEGGACGACGKTVCFSCSVSNLGDEKRCLACAGRKVWVEGVAWANSELNMR